MKEEPDDAALSPTEAEKPSIAVLREHGVPTDDAVQILRRTGHNLQAAIKQSLDMLTNRDNWRREDMARLESEKEKDKVAAERRLNDMTLTVVGDIKPRFQQVRFATARRQSCYHCRHKILVLFLNVSHRQLLCVRIGVPTGSGSPVSCKPLEEEDPSSIPGRCTICLSSG